MLYQRNNPHGGDLYGRGPCLDFSANTNPLGTPESVRLAVIEAAQSLDRYPDPYCRALTAAISDYEHVPQSRILCGSGAAELIYAYCAALRPRRALELAPTFSEYSAALESVGCRVERHRLRPEQWFQPDGGLIEAIRQGPWDVVFLCNPNNPTGQLLEPSVLLEAAAVCRERHIRLFLDECFLDLTDRADDSMRSYLDEFPELFILKAFTKSFGMAGLRLGYGLSADSALLAAMSRMVQPWNISGPAQAAGVAALQETAFLERTRQLLRQERPWLKTRLEQLGLEVCPSRANYLLLRSDLDLAAQLPRQGIVVRDCSNYCGLGIGWYRAAIRQREENLQLVEAIGRLREAKV